MIHIKKEMTYKTDREVTNFHHLCIVNKGKQLHSVCKTENVIEKNFLFGKKKLCEKDYSHMIKKE